MTGPAVLRTAVLLALCTAGTAARGEDVSNPFPDAPAVVLDAKSTWTIESESCTLDVHRRLLVWTDEAVHEGSQRVLYVPDSVKLTSLEAKTVLPGDRTLPVPPELMQDTVLFKRGDATVRQRKISFPGVEAGAVLDLHYVLRQDSFCAVLPDVTSPGWWAPQGQYPAVSTQLEIRVHKDGPEFRLGESGRNANRCRTDSHLDERTAESVTTVTCKEVPAVVAEPVSAPTSTLRYRLVVATSLWNRFAPGVWERILGSLKPFDDSFKEVLRKAGTERGHGLDTMRAIVVYARDHFRITDRTADTFDDFVGSGGTATQYVTALYWLLEKAGLGPKLGWVADRSEGPFRLEMNDYGRLERWLLILNLNQQEITIDPLCRECAVGVVDPDYTGPGSGGLRFDSPSSTMSLKSVAGNTARENSIVRVRRHELAADGSRVVRGTSTWSMQAAVDTRQRWRGMSGAERTGAVVAAMPRDAENPQVTFRNVDDPELPATLEFSYSRPASAVASPDLLLLPEDPDVDLPLQESRTNDVWWRYPHTETLTVTYVLPAGFKTGKLPAPVEWRDAGLEFRGRWSEGGPGEVVLTTEWVVGVTSIDPDQYRGALQLYARIRSFARKGVVASRTQPAG